MTYVGDEITAKVVWLGTGGAPVDATTVFRFQAPDGTVTQQNGASLGAATGTYTAVKILNQRGVWIIWAIASVAAIKTQHSVVIVESGAPAVT